MDESAQECEGREREKKEPYRKPEIVFSQKVEARAVVCAKANDVCIPSGPLFS
ncbi:MAG TPA: hypothetical protein VGR38_11210 [Candidatus Polarisedimenticolia bacterium]|jgi:hypothetical protein|nr:hypothetical protein [Candidatus Polarisedimenticolia bacterium]